MKSKKRSVTIQDVAKAAGVSVSTVSRVLNGKVDVASETQEHILAVIEQMDYTSSLAARSMRSSSTNLIGLIMPDIEYPYAVEIMKGVNRAVAESDYDLLVYTTGNVQKLAAASHEQRFVALLNNSITDGVIIVAPATPKFVSDSPIVSIDPHHEYPNYPSVHATNYQGAMDAMQYLLGLGHTRIGFISGRPELESAKRRLMGYRDALKEVGIPYDPDLVAPGDFTARTAMTASRQLLSLPNPPTAIFSGNDQSAMGVYDVAQEMGLRIPEDLSVIGFDNIPDARYMNLTTVDQFLSEMGSIATRTLIRIINHEILDNLNVRVDTKLVIRGSCAQR